VTLTVEFILQNARVEMITAMKIQVVVFWVVTSYSDVQNVFSRVRSLC